MVKKGDIVTVVLTGFITLLLFITSFMPKENLTAYIYADGKLVHEADFINTAKPYTFTVSDCEIEISKNGVCFKNSDCPDKLCEKSGVLSKNTQTACCVPKMVVIVIKGDKPKNEIVTY